jgi:hypothetical protein
MDKRKEKSFMINDKIDILAEVDACIGTRVDQASQLELKMSTLNTLVKDLEAMQISYMQCGSFSKNWELFKYLLLEELESALQASMCKQRFHRWCYNQGEVTAHLGIDNFTGSNDRINRFKGRNNVEYRTHYNLHTSMCIMLYLHCKNIRPYGNPHFFKVRNFHLP